MIIVRRLWLFVIRTILLAVGILLLVTAIPHKDPWNMSLIAADANKWTVTISFPGVKELNLFSIIKFPFQTSPWTIFISAGVCLLILVFITSAGRRAFINSLKKVKSIPAILIPMSLFIFTLKPTKNGLPIILYLTFGSMGMAFSLVGIYPLIIWLGKYRFGRVICEIVKSIVSFFLNVKLRYFLGGIFLITFIATNFSSYFIFEHIPHIQDSLDQVFHGKIFASGHLTVPSHKYKEFFDFTHMINDGKWYSEYPPGHSFLMMFGAFLGIPWIINPLMGSLSIITFYYIGREIYDEKTGRLAALLGLFSPFIIFMSSEFMSHGSALFFISLFILFFAKTVKYGKFFHPIISGASLGVALNGRPMTVFAIFVPFVIYSTILLIIKLFQLRRKLTPVGEDKRFLTDIEKGGEYIINAQYPKYQVKNRLSSSIKLILNLTILAATISLFIGILLLFNYLTTSDPLLFGYEVKWGKGHNPGFGHSGWGEPHTPSKGLRQNLNNLNAFNKYLFEWPIPCFFFAFLLFVSISREKWDYLLISSFWCLSIAYFFYWFQDWCFGPRFMYESSVMAILLTARGILSMPKLVNDTFGLKTNPARIKSTVGVLVIICIIIGLSFHIKPLVKVYSSNYWSVNASVLKAIKKQGIKNAVVFTKSYYGSVLPANSPTFDGDIIYVRDLGMKNRLMMEYYPDRKYYRADGSKITEIFLEPEDKGIIECEYLEVVETSPGDSAIQQDMESFGAQWSNNSQILSLTDAKGEYIVLAVPAEKDGVYQISAAYTKAHDFALVQLFVNGKPLGKPYDTYNKTVIHSGKILIGNAYLHKGDNLFKFQSVDKNKDADNYRFGVDCLFLTPGKIN